MFHSEFILANLVPFISDFRYFPFNPYFMVYSQNLELFISDFRCLILNSFSQNLEPFIKCFILNLFSLSDIPACFVIVSPFVMQFLL